MEANKYLLEQLKERELFNCNTDDCWQVLAEIVEDYAKLYSNEKLDELAHQSQEMIYDRRDTKPNPDGGLILRNFQVCYAIPKQSVIKAKDKEAQLMQERYNLHPTEEKINEVANHFYGNWDLGLSKDETVEFIKEIILRLNPPTT